jgi:hypothetical protein
MERRGRTDSHLGATGAFALVIAAVACRAPAPTPVTVPASSPTGSATTVPNQAAPAAATPAEPPPSTTAGAILAWPVTPLTKAQVAEVKGCDVDKLAESRYAKSLDIDALAGAFSPKSTCDEAALADACAMRLGDEESAKPPPPCLDAYRAAIKANPAFVYAGGLLGGYFGKVTQVAAPPIAAHALASVQIDYKWDGLGAGVKWTLNVDSFGGTPAMRVSGANAPLAAWSTEIGTDFAALGRSLESFMPIAKPLQAVNCYDNYPDWTITLAFDDGSKVVLVTNGSNLLGLGGPWHTTLGGVTYMQTGPGLAHAVHAIITVLGMPLGQPMAMTCHGFDVEAAVLP